MRLSFSIASAAALSAPLAVPSAQVINEVRTDQFGADSSEYFELFGAPGASLDGVTYFVVGDGLGGSGVIEAVIDLTGQVIPADGFFVAGEPTFETSVLGDVVDLRTSLAFENSDNVTHFLVTGFTGALGDDLDVDDDGVLDVLPFATELDRLAIIEEENPPAGTEFHYGPPTVGPDGGFAPGHVYRAPDGAGSLRSFNVGVFDLFDKANATDTPGGPNSVGRALVDGSTAHSLALDAGPANGSRRYLILGSLSGTSPGIPVESIVVPLNRDTYFDLTLVDPGAPPFEGYLGVLDPAGRGFARFSIPPALAGSPALVGLDLDHAFVLFDPVCDFASNPVALRIVELAEPL